MTRFRRREVLRGAGIVGLGVVAPSVFSGCAFDLSPYPGGRLTPDRLPLPDGSVPSLSDLDGPLAENAGDGLARDGLPVYAHPGALGPADLFQHGVASGDPLKDAIILWTRITPEENEDIAVWWEIARDPEFRQREQVGVAMATIERDFTVKIDVDRLSPETTYYYRFFALGRSSIVGRTRTAPARGLSAARFAVMSCSSLAHGYFHAYRRVSERDDIDAVIHLGDYIYEYGPSQFGSVRIYDPAHEILTLSDYRTRYSQYRKDEDLQAAHQAHPFITVWDDHESANDAWKDGAQNHDPMTEGDWYARKAAAVTAYSEWMPIRDQEVGKIWRSFRWGDLIDLLMLDTRLWGRNQPPALLSGFFESFDFTKQMLGQDQERWLFRSLRQSSARWQVLGQQVMMAPLQAGGLTLNHDQWDGYKFARARLFDTIRRAGIQGSTVVLTGDIHTAWANELTDQPLDASAYDPSTGRGAVGVEFVTTSVTSSAESVLGPLSALLGGVAGAEKLVRDLNPHIKYARLSGHGYYVLDVDEGRVQADYFHLDGVLPEATGAEDFSAGFQSVRGTPHLRQADRPSEGPSRGATPPR